MYDQTARDHRPASLGEGPIANSIQGGHFAKMDGIPFPRWIVAVESTTTDGPHAGVVVDLVHRSVGRWFLVSPGDPLVKAASCGMRLRSRHLCIPTVYRMDGGHLDHDLQIGMIAPIVDHLSSWWEHRDGPMPIRADEDGRGEEDLPDSDPNRAVIDSRAAAMLADLHAGARAEETHEGVWILQMPQEDREDEEGASEAAGIYRRHAGSAGYQLAHWGLATWTGSSSLSITPAGRGLAHAQGNPAGPAKGCRSQDVEIGRAPGILIVDHEIDEPRELEVRCDGKLHVDRKHDGWGRNGGSVNLRFDDRSEAIVMDMSTARALVDQIAPPLVKGPVSRVRVEQRDPYNRPVVSTISIGDGEIVIRTAKTTIREAYEIRLDAIKARMLRTILREAVKKEGRGGGLDDVEIVNATRRARYTAATWI